MLCEMFMFSLIRIQTPSKVEEASHNAAVQASTLDEAADVKGLDKVQSIFSLLISYLSKKQSARKASPI